jgi:hypothetical protein
VRASQLVASDSPVNPPLLGEVIGRVAQRVPFLVAELGADVDPFVLHLFAALAEKERAMIAERGVRGGARACGCRLRGGSTRARGRAKARLRGPSKKVIRRLATGPSCHWVN